jgi:hypothetical protein
MVPRRARNMGRLPAPSRARRHKANTALRRKVHIARHRSQADRARTGSPMVPRRGRVTALRRRVSTVRSPEPKATRPVRSQACRRATARNGAQIIRINVASCSASRKSSSKAVTRLQANKGHHPTRAVRLPSSSNALVGAGRGLKPLLRRSVDRRAGRRRDRAK